MPSSDPAPTRRAPEHSRLIGLLESPAPALLITALVHVLLLTWLLQAGQPRDSSSQADQRLWVEWLQAAPAPTEVPPMPQPPSRDLSLSARRLPDPGLIAPALGQPPVTEARAETSNPPASFIPGRLIDRIGLQLGESGRLAAPAQGNPLERAGPRLPGREEAFVEGFYVREETSPADYMAMVGGLLFGGGGGATCGDLRRKMTSDISDAERRKLIHDERQICRRGEAGTYRR